MIPLNHKNMTIDMTIGMGLAPGMKNVSIFGLIPNTDTTRQLVWGLGGAISDSGIFPTTAQIVYLSSSNVSDTAVMNVTYLDENYIEVVQQIVLSGQDAVSLQSTAIRINSITNISSLPLLGNVYAGTESLPTAGVPAIANTMQYVDVDRQVDSGMFYSVPAGYTLLVTNFAGGNTRNEENDLQGSFTIGNSGNLIVGLDLQLTANYVDLPIAYFALSEKSDIAVTTQSITGNNDVVRGRLRAILVDNSLISSDT